MPVHTLQSNVAYARELARAGWDGIASAHRAAPRFNRLLWTPAVIGGALGALSTRLSGKRKSASVAAGGLVGSIVGCGAALAWASRGSLVPAARNAAQRVNAVRDAHWLATNPIDYA